MVDKIIKIPKWQFKTINNALRLTHRINNCHTKETAFDREVVKAYEYSKSALAEPSSVSQANELSPIVINWAYFPEDKPNYGDEILIYPPPEQLHKKEVLIYGRYTDLIDGTKWVLLTPCL